LAITEFLLHKAQKDLSIPFPIVGDRGLVITVIAALALGVAFVAGFAFFMTPAPKEMPTIQEEFQQAERLHEVQLFREKYPDFTSGFARNGTAITYYYNASRWGDADGDGYDESFRRLTLSATFEEGLNVNRGTISKLEQIQAKCYEATDNDRTLRNFLPPVYGEENVTDFLQHSKCII
jgi:hypothetical protein